MPAEPKNLRHRLQSLLPLKGRWLRYFLWGIWFAAGYAVLQRWDVLGCWGFAVMTAVTMVIRGWASTRDTPPGA